MHFAKTVSLLAAGAVIGIALVLSCSDGSPRMADAADPTCNCPAAESPIPGRVVQIEQATTVPPNDIAPGGAGCPLDAIALSGGCAANAGQSPQIILEQSIPGDRAWDCRWRNPTNAPIPVRAIVRCLKPAP
jgi:hypothetical protein